MGKIIRVKIRVENTGKNRSQNTEKKHEETIRIKCQ